MNNVDVAEAMIECVKQAIKETCDPNVPEKPITFIDLLTALEQYIKSEQHEILKARERKDKPFG